MLLNPVTVKVQCYKLLNFVKASIMMNQEKETEEIKLEKRQRFWDFLTMILSISYAIFIIMVGKII